MTIRLNYSTEALKDLEKVVRDDRIYSAHVTNVRRFLRQAVKFQMPQNGKLIADVSTMNPDLARVFRLPFPVVALETPVEGGATKKLITLPVDSSLVDLPGVFAASVFSTAGGCLLVSINYAEHRRMWVADLYASLVPYEQAHPPERVSALGARLNRLASAPIGPFSDRADPILAREGGWEAARARVSAESWLDLNGVMNLALCSQCTNVETETLGFPRQPSRQQARNGGAPFFEAKVLVLKRGVNERGSDAGGSHASPRLHLRRVHVRRLGEGRLTWVRQAIVGDKSRGIIHKDYSVSA